jgi:hypothetical protein
MGGAQNKYSKSERYLFSCPENGGVGFSDTPQSKKKKKKKTTGGFCPRATKN